MRQTTKDYEKLKDIARHTRVLSGINAHLGWDQETFMPPGAADIRAEQLKVMAGLIHKEKTGKKFVSALGTLIDIPKGTFTAKGLTEAEKAALKYWRRDYLKEKALPLKFVEELAQLSSQSILVWRNAKKEKNFKLFAPYLEKLIAMDRKKADYFGYEENPYDALLDQYEPDMTVKKINQLFSPLRTAIIKLLKDIARASPIDDSFLHGTFSHAKQLEFSKKIMHDMGYDENYGRLDLSTHPFSSASHPSDSRITTRIHPTSVMSCISVVLHEGGHALYEMGLPQEHYGSPLGDSISLGIHESQSRWWETRIGQSKAFWHYYLPLLKKQFPGKLDSITLDAFYAGINKVEPSLIRVEADEVTYSLHVILRFELEQLLIEGKLKVKDLPEAWNEKMKELLGISPKSDDEGCLQDIHWSMGAFGYFPTYTLGNMYAAHLFEAFNKQHPDWEKKVAQGQLNFIKQWLNENVHQHGRRYSSMELLKNVTGKDFTATPFITYLEKKYKGLLQ